MNKSLNVTDRYMLQQMQQLAANMTALPQTGGSRDTTEGTSFQDMIEKASEKTEPKSGEANEKTVEKKDPQSPEKEKAPAEKDQEEELKAENVTANPAVAAYVDLFRPEIAPAAEETAGEPVLMAEAPVEMEAEPEMAVDLPVMETAETVESAEVPEEIPGEGFHQTLEKTAEPVEEAPVQQREDQPAEAEQTVETREVREEMPEAEVETVRPEEDTDEPKAEAVETQEPVFHDAKAATVKVGETYETVDTQAPDVEEKLANTIQQAVQSGAERVEIRLTPENLGALTIEMTKDVSGVLQVVLHASNSRAAGLLNQHISGLHAALQNYSQEPVQIEVQRGEESQQQSLHQQTDPDGRGQRQQHQQQETRKEENQGDFLQKLRLGLFDGETL